MDTFNHTCLFGDACKGRDDAQCQALRSVWQSLLTCWLSVLAGKTVGEVTAA
jgi:hypothetical protein